MLIMIVVRAKVLDDVIDVKDMGYINTNGYL